MNDWVKISKSFPMGLHHVRLMCDFMNPITPSITKIDDDDWVEVPSHNKKRKDPPPSNVRDGRSM